ncbi:uncharacterized protein LOC130502841 [Raphanus sativus]|uniref:Uncharacterized protein LOC130502841 n=1 Tax=Raphanus sativus TaxID=3726 RepID=A0A9W3CPW7_RAPSA|nr:uncharacterized protein LOC130502841 [Raphanus sativus]
MSQHKAQEVSPANFDWIKDVWNSKCSPKMRIFLWSIIQNALPLGEALNQRGIQNEALCVKCKQKESAMHIFFQCPFAIEVWNLLPLHRVVHLATDCDFKKAVVAFRNIVCLPPSGVTTAILPWKILTPTETATKAVRLAREWINAQPHKETEQRGVPTLPEATRSRSARELVPTCKSDAAFNQQSNRAGLAWIIYDASGKPLRQGSSSQELVASPLVAEALSLRAGIVSAVSLELPKLKMLSDNVTLIRAINNDAQAKEIYGIVKSIQQIASVFVEITFDHVSRSSNVEADRLAKLALLSSSSFISNP